MAFMAGTSAASGALANGTETAADGTGADDSTALGPRRGEGVGGGPPYTAADGTSWHPASMAAPARPIASSDARERET
jgi:hypothetical protein